MLILLIFFFIYSEFGVILRYNLLHKTLNMHFSCWLNLNSIWSFFGPACVIIFVSKKNDYRDETISLKLSSVL